MKERGHGRYEKRKQIADIALESTKETIERSMFIYFGMAIFY